VEGCVADCTIELPVSPAELVEPVELVEIGCPSAGYHPLFCRNGYQLLSSEAWARKGIDSNINNTAIFRNIAFSPVFLP